MAKRKVVQDLELEKQPLFLKTLEYLPTDPEELEQLAGQMLELFNDAMRAGSTRDIETSALRYGAVVYRLNGDTFLGSGAKDGAGTRLQQRFAAPAGTVPGWGQIGQFLLEVDGMPIRVEVDHLGGFNGVCSLGFCAVDTSAPFLSETGYLSHFMHAEQHVGQELSQAVRMTVEKLLRGEFKPKAIREENFRWIENPAWLAPALQAVTSDGQLTMPLSGEAQLPAPAERAAPMSNAERQRRHRQRLKELSDTEGLKVIPLTRTERCVLSLGILAHEDLDHRPNDWATTKKPGFDALLSKLWPEGDNGRYLAEPTRSTRRPTAFLRDELERQKTMVRRLQEENRALRVGESVAGEVVIDDGAPCTWSRTVKLTRDEDSLMLWAFRVFFTARSDLKLLDSKCDGNASFAFESLERIFQGCPIWTDELKADLDKDEGILNGNKYRDKEAKRGWKSYEDERKQNSKLFKEQVVDRAEIKRLQDALQQIAQEVAGGAVTTPNTIEARLREEISGLRDQNALEIADRGQAFDAVAVLQARLKKSGLCSDYRRQPGE